MDSKNPPLHVLMSFGEHVLGANSYCADLVGQLAAHDVAADTFTWRRAFSRKYDLVHFHWPDHLVDGGAKKSWTKLAPAMMFLAVLAVRRVPIVLTRHNLGAHDGASAPAKILTRRVEKQVTLEIHLNEADLITAPHSVVILHSLYPRVWSGAARRKENSILYFGLVRPYKGVEALIEAFGGMDVSGSTLSIIGSPLDPEYAQTLRRASAAYSGVECSLEFVDETSLQKAILGCQLVVLPYRNMYNSGSLLLAMSLDTPVLVPRNPVNESLVREFGDDMVYLYDGSLTPRALGQALSCSAGQGQAISQDTRWRRSTASSAALHNHAYRAVVGAKSWRVKRRREKSQDRLKQNPSLRGHSRLNRSDTGE